MSVPFEKLLERLGKAISIEIHGNFCEKGILENDALLSSSILKRHLLPLLQAGQAMRDASTQDFFTQLGIARRAWDAERERLAGLGGSGA